MVTCHSGRAKCCEVVSFLVFTELHVSSRCRFLLSASRSHHRHQDREHPFLNWNTLHDAVFSRSPVLIQRPQNEKRTHHSNCSRHNRPQEIHHPRRKTRTPGTNLQEQPRVEPSPPTLTIRMYTSRNLVSIVVVPREMQSMVSMTRWSTSGCMRRNRRLNLVLWFGRVVARAARHFGREG